MSIIDNTETNKAKFAPVTAYIKEKKITWYSLAKLTDIPEGTLYAYRVGRLCIPDNKCKRIADALGLELQVLFPKIKDVEPVDFTIKKNSAEQSPTNPGLDPIGNEEPEQSIEESNMKIEAEDMQAGCQALFDEEEANVVKVRCVRTMDHIDFEGVTLSEVENVIVKTGIKAERFNTDRMLFKLNKFLVENNELAADSAVYNYNNELCVVIHNVGRTFEIGNGKTLGYFVFL